MSATDWTLRCPHGHTNVFRRTGHNTKRDWAQSEYYCRTCADYPEHYATPHHSPDEVTRTQPKGSNVDLGYVWSPSHDE